MSHKTYDEEWKVAQEALSATLQSEPIQADRRENRTLLATLYIRYIMICNRLAEIVDQMIQTQKRTLVRKLLESTLGRVLELKSDLVEADLNEWTHCGDIIETLHITPEDCELKVPTCFRNERRDDIEYKKNFINEILSKMGYVDKTKEKAPMTEQKAILIIQTHERARQGRLRAQFMKEIRSMKEKSKPIVGEVGLEEGEDKTSGISLPAALRIQKIWRGYVARRATRRRKLQEMLLIGMIPQIKEHNEDIERDLEIKERRRKLQERRQYEYEEAVRKCREHLEATQRGAVLEQLSDQVRGWLHEYKEQTGKIPEFTGSERTGSRLLLSRQGTDSELSKSEMSSKDSKAKKEKGSKSKDSKSTGEEDEVASMKAIVSTFVPELNNYKEEYDEVWKAKDESSNLRQSHYMDIIEQEQMTDMENELRKVVDEMMRAELQLLQDALDKDRGHKGKRSKRAKARRGGKKSKKKREKDLTPDRTLESLFEELLTNGIIRKIPEVYFKDFKGERSYNVAPPHNKGVEPKAALGDFRQIMTEYCAIPLCSPKVHMQAEHIKSVLLAGSKGSGKDMLVHAVCNEVGAVLFDLTPANLAGKYPGRTGLIMLVHMVIKMARLLQPAVIYMDNAERPFVKKIPKTDKTDPKKLKKDLPKMVKNFSPEDRIMLIGVTSCPWDSDQKLLQQVYQKCLVISRPDYSSRFCLWQSCLGKYSAISWQFDTSVMAKISDGYTSGAIVSTVEDVMTVKRMVQLRVKPLSPFELVNVLCTKPTVYKEEDEAMQQWWTKTPMSRKRSKAVETLIEEEAELQAKQANAK